MNFSFVYLAVFALGSGVYGQDAGTLPSPPGLSSFSCHGRAPGYYADLDSGCKIYHVCDGNSHFTYVCPRRTLFQQRSRTCDHSYLVRCKESDEDEENYNENEEEILVRLGESEERRTTIKGNIEGEYTEAVPTSTETTETTEFSTTDFLLSTVTTDVPETATATGTQEIPTEPATVEPKEKPLKKFIKFRLKDFRWLFYIPEVDNSIVAEPEREFVVALDGNDFLTFKNRRYGRSGPGLCPSHCDSRFFLAGTCHPCITIK